MKKIFLSILTSACLFGATSCSDMLDVDSSRQVENPSLDQKTDSVYYAYGIMQAMQQLADQYFFQNEMRGDLVEPTNKASVDLQALSNFTAGTDCKYDSVYLYYKVINNCNYYLAKRDTNLATGAQNVVMNEYVAIASFRAWAYLQLTHQYGNVPYVTEPMLTISQINAVKDVTDYKQILASQAEFLQALKNRLPEDQLSVPFYRSDVNIGRTQWGENKNITPSKLFIPINMILGDLYLELGEYEKAALAYFDYLRLTAKTADEISKISVAQATRYPLADNIHVYVPPVDYEQSKNQTEFKNYLPWNTNFTSDNYVISYIPMAVNHTYGTVTGVPLAFGYNYYGNESSSSELSGLSVFNNKCPVVEDVQVTPTAEYLDMAHNSAFYYFTQQERVAPFRWVLSQANLGDARANSVVSPITNDETLKNNVYVSKPATGNFYLYRNVTVYLRLAEAFNRMGYPDLAFAILKNGLHAGLSQFTKDKYDATATNPIPEKNYYLSNESYQVLETKVPFLSETYKQIFTNTSTTAFIGIHKRGAGAVDDIMSPYQYNDIVEARIDKIREQFGVGSGEYTKEEYINAVEDLLCDEYAMEFAFEGTRFSDLLRIARHKNMGATYGDGTFGDKWLSKKLEKKAAGITTQNCFLPFK